MSEQSKLGGWTYAEGLMPRNALEVLTEALSKQVGVNITPVLFLGSQVVSGVNYAFLCWKSVVAPNSEATLNVVIVNRDPAGVCSIVKNYPAIQ
ncbi:MAG: hypothetical protein IJV43_06885 [Oscillospiraceae bacterium]|nr:hypothetical protein [Oscillospiraceae bacterium]